MPLEVIETPPSSGEAYRTFAPVASVLYLTLTISTWPSRRRTVTPTSCGWRSRRMSIRASPIARSVSLSQSIVSGSRPRVNGMRRPAHRCARQASPRAAGTPRPPPRPAAHTQRDRAWGIRDHVSGKTTNQLRQPMQIDGFTQIGHRRQNPPRTAGEAIPRHPRGNDCVVVRPDGAVVIGLRVVSPLGRGHGAHAPPGERAIIHQRRTYTFGPLGRDDAGKQTMSRDSTSALGRAACSRRAPARRSQGRRTRTPARTAHAAARLEPASHWPISRRRAARPAPSAFPCGICVALHLAERDRRLSQEPSA